MRTFNNEWMYGSPPNDGDTYEVIMASGLVHRIFFCPQQGWINENWDKFDESEIIEYRWYSK